MKKLFIHHLKDLKNSGIWKYLFISLFLLNFTVVLISEEVDIPKAKRVAINCFAEKTDQRLSIADIKEVIVESKENLPLIYIFNLNEGGFILVAANDVSIPIIGYSDKGQFQSGNHSPAFKNQLDFYKEQIFFAIKKNTSPLPEAVLKWNKYDKGVAVFKGEKSKSVLPFLSSKWDQNLYYNAACPLDPAGPDGHALVGCVATAMGQVLNYWSHPWYGEGSHGYTHDSYGYLFADFNTLYNYDSMPDSAQNYRPHIANLLYHCGVSVDMDYGSGSSGAWPWTWPGCDDVANALKDYFYFSSSTSNELRSSHPFDWHDLMKNDLDMGRPIIYGGNDLADPTVGHAWVVHGYDGDLYYMNWGWSGSEDGFFTLDNLTPPNILPNNLNDYHRAVFWAEPKAGTLSGTITLAESPYILNYDHSIQYGDVLTVEPGVIILFWGRYHLNVYGQLNALGTEMDTIIFTSNDPNHGWGGLRFNGNSSPDSCRLSYCKFMDGIALHKTTASGNFRFQNLNEGGAIFLEDASAVSFSNCLFTDNRSFWEGGAISAIDMSDFLIENSVVSQNIAGLVGGGINLSGSALSINNSKMFLNESDSSGGAIYIDNSELKLLNDTIYLNESDYGGGITSINSNTSDVWIFGSRISYNQATEKGGGIYCTNTDILFSNNFIYDNFSGSDGGGLYCEGSDIIMSHNTFQFNDADAGGGIYFVSCDPLVEHSSFFMNEAELGGGIVFNNSNGNFNYVEIVYNIANYGGGIFFQSVSSPVLNRLTISDNTANSMGGAIYSIYSDPVVKNSILWNNDGTQEFYFDENSDPVVTYSDIKLSGQDIWPGTGNINADPLFVAPTWNNFHLSWLTYPDPETKSPCIDMGDPTSTNDPDGTRADMGAFSYDQTYTAISGGDINGTLTCDNSPYFVFGDITVPTGEELIIEPCVYVIFHGDYKLTVNGRLISEGTGVDKITFYPADRYTGWGGIRFFDQNTNGQDSSKLVHCRIMYGNADVMYGYDAYGGGVYLNNSSEVLIDNCLFFENRAITSGGGMFLTQSSPIVRNSTFIGNSALNGGAVLCYDNVNTTFLNCYFSENSAEYGGAVVVSSCAPNFSGSSMVNNHATKFGGAIYHTGGQEPTFDPINRCNIYNNYADYAGLDFYTAADVYVPPVIDVYLDTASVALMNEHFAYPFNLFNTSSINSRFIQENSDLYVSTIGSDLFSGTSASNPLKTIKMALIKIIADSENPKRVFVANGVYSPSLTGETLPINHRSYVTIIGESPVDTKIDGDSLSRIMVSYADIYDTVQQIGFQNGYMDGDGGAVVIEEYSNPTFYEVDMIYNYCTGDGGAIWCTDHCSPVFYGGSIMYNYADNSGGGIFLQSNDTILLDHVAISSNTSRYAGGGIWAEFYDYFHINYSNLSSNNLLNGGGGGAFLRQGNVRIDNTTFSLNNVLGSGGGLHTSYNVNLDINKCSFTNNGSSEWGGGMYFYHGVDANLENVKFFGNSSVQGGGIYGTYGSSLEIRNGLFYSNNTLYDTLLYGKGDGGAMNLSFVETNLYNITVANNQSSMSGGGLYFYSDASTVHSVQNSIIYNNTSEAIATEFDASVDVNYSDIEGGWSTGDGNINADPDFAAEYWLNAGSPCINAANPDTTGLNLPMFDLADNPRVSNYRLDMGAYEFFEGITLVIDASLEGPFNGISMNTSLTNSSKLPIQQPYNIPPWNYNGSEEAFSGFPENTVDWLLLQVRDTTDVTNATPESIRGQQAVFLLSDGSIKDIFGTYPRFANPIEHQCYVVIYHRNHLGIISAYPLTDLGGGAYIYDFTTPAGQAYGTDAQKDLGSGVYGLFGGDANADGTINEEDKTAWSNQVGQAGYLQEDLKLDGQVNNQDKNEILINNTGNSSQMPE